MLPATLRTDTVRQNIAASKVCDVKFDYAGWQQSTLPIAQGCLGLSLAVNVSLPAYASSLSANRQLVGQILQYDFEYSPTSEVDSVADHWTALGHEPITTDRKPFKWHWSSTVHEDLFRSLKADASPSRQARIMTAAQGQSGDWITAYPIAQIETQLNDEVLRIGIALRVILQIYLDTSVDVGLLSNQTTFIHFRAVSVLINFPGMPRSTT